MIGHSLVSGHSLVIGQSLVLWQSLVMVMMVMMMVCFLFCFLQTIYMYLFQPNQVDRYLAAQTIRPETGAPIGTALGQSLHQ